MDGEEEGSPPKRRKKRTTMLQEVFKMGPELTLRLSKSMAVDLHLSFPAFIEIEKLEFITFNSNCASYLYYICGSLFEVDSKDLDIFYSSDGNNLEDDSDKWWVVEETDPILKGYYLVTFLDGAVPNFTFVNVSSRSTTTESSSTTPQKSIKTKKGTPTTPKTSHQVTESATGSKTPSSSSKNDELRRNVVMRDGGCVVTGVVEDMCINSHVIPRRLFNNNMTITVGAFTFISQYDPSICLCLCPDLDKCLDKFHGSICQLVESA